MRTYKITEIYYVDISADEVEERREFAVRWGLDPERDLDAYLGSMARAPEEVTIELVEERAQILASELINELAEEERNEN